MNTLILRQLFAPLRNPSNPLSDAQIASFNENGFLALDAITTPAELAMLKNVFDRLVRCQAGVDEGAQYDLIGEREAADARLLQIMNPANYAAELRDTIFRAKALAIARQLLGNGAAPFFEHAICKPPHRGSATPWHQDEAYRSDPNFEYREVSIWMPLQDVTLQNGCMQFLQGSHRGELQPHRPLNNDPSVHQLECCAEIDARSAVPCPIAAGGCTIHTGRTLHYAGPNYSGSSRWAYIIAFDLPPRRRSAMREFPWNDERRPTNVLRRRTWLRRGGAFTHIWRTLRRMPKDPQRVYYWVRRALRELHNLDRSDDGRT